MKDALINKCSVSVKTTYASAKYFVVSINCQAVIQGKEHQVSNCMISLQLLTLVSYPNIHTFIAQRNIQLYKIAIERLAVTIGIGILSTYM